MNKTTTLTPFEHWWLSYWKPKEGELEMLTLAFKGLAQVVWDKAYVEGYDRGHDDGQNYMFNDNMK